MRKRRSIRLRDYDYTQDGAYFVTLCTTQRKNLFGDIHEGEMNLNTLGCVADDCWLAIETLHPGVELDAYVIMPNHVHGIIVINRWTGHGDDTGHGNAVSLPGRSEGFGKPIIGSLSTLVRSYKSVVTRQINQLRQSPGAAVWQGRYYEHIIRNAADLKRIREYILYNPARWSNDDYFQE